MDRDWVLMTLVNASANQMLLKRPRTAFIELSHPRFSAKGVYQRQALEKDIVQLLQFIHVGLQYIKMLNHR